MAGMIYQMYHQHNPKVISAGFVDYIGEGVRIRGKSEELNIGSHEYDEQIITMAAHHKSLYTSDYLSEQGYDVEKGKSNPF